MVVPPVIGAAFGETLESTTAAEAEDAKSKSSKNTAAQTATCCPLRAPTDLKGGMSLGYTDAKE
jgi:hypothetical protein